MEGGTDEDNKRYLEFLRYCEEQREESLRRREEDEDRKKRALAKERAWEMLRESVNADGDEGRAGVGGFGT